MTEDKLWEPSVALGTANVLKMMTDLEMPESITRIADATDNVLIDLGAMVSGLAQDIKRYGGGADQ